MTTPAARLEFGGPDLPPRRLRDILEAQIDAAPAGSRIDWATYYFRDRALADALIRASRRGVGVRVALDATPRRAGANDAVIAMLSSPQFAGRLSLRRTGWWFRGHLHAKIYAFSDPAIAWIGSFNPSGDDVHDAETIADIGDQDRGHNLLLGLRHPKLVRALRRQVGRLALTKAIRPERYRPAFNLPVRADGVELFFYPRVRTEVVEEEIDGLGAGDRVKAAISHLRDGPLGEALVKAAARGADIRVLTHDTERRVSSKLMRQLSDAGVEARRVTHPEGLPMHAKFIVVERQAGPATATLGSYNFNDRSRFWNAEVLARVAEPGLVSALGARFEEIAAMAEAS